MLVNWLLNLKLWPGLGGSGLQKSKFMTENRKKLLKPALCAYPSKDRQAGFLIILNCHPVPPLPSGFCVNHLLLGFPPDSYILWQKMWL